MMENGFTHTDEHSSRDENKPRYYAFSTREQKQESFPLSLSLILFFFIL